MPWRLADDPKSEARFAVLLREQLGMTDSAAELVVSSFAAAACDEGIASDAESWAGALRETILECGLPDEDQDVLADIVAALRRLRLLADAPAPAQPLALGARVLALLSEDGQWHDAVVDALLEPGEGAAAPGRRYRVVFSEYGKPQELGEAEIVNVEDVVSDDDEGGCLRDGECELCARSMSLTFHHLIPRECHGRFVGKALPAGIRGEPTRAFLGSYGMELCRACHTHLHRVASNDELADALNTAARVRAHPEVSKFVVYIGKQRVRLRA